MNPSKLSRRITIQEKQTVRDEEGTAITKWVDLITIWATRKPLRGREFFEAAAIQYENTIRYEIRYREGLKEGMRVVEKGRTYSIYAVLDDVYGDRTLSHLMTQEVIGNV